MTQFWRASASVAYGHDVFDVFLFSFLSHHLHVPVKTRDHRVLASQALMLDFPGGGEMPQRLKAIIVNELHRGANPPIF